MSIDIKLHKKDLPDDLHLGNVLAVDGEFMGLNIRRDPLRLIQISSGKNDAHIVQLNRESYKCPNLRNLLENCFLLPLKMLWKMDDFVQLVVFPLVFRTLSAPIQTGHPL